MNPEPIERACGVCGRAADRQHPCRFEVGCSCWRVQPCDGTGRKGRRLPFRVAISKGRP